MQKFYPEGVKLPFVYVISDYTTESILKMKQHPWYAEYIAQGVVDFAVVDCESSDVITLELANKKLTPDTVKNPLFLVANYVFSNLRNDAIRIENSSVLHGLLSLLCPQDNPDMVNIIPHLQLFFLSELTARFIWKYTELADSDMNQYDPDLQAVIQRYRTEIPNGTVLLPITVLAFLKKCLTISNQRLVVLCGDIGSRMITKIAAPQNPYINIHGSFSMPTNFHAIDAFVENHNGHVFSSPYLEGFNNTVYIMGIDPKTLPTMRWMIHHAFSTFIPESFNITQKCLKEESSPSPSVAAVISVLRLARFDTDVFMKFKQVLIERGGYAGSSPATRKDILFDLSGVRSQYYPIKSTYDVCFELARIHMGIKEYDTAIKLFSDSNANCADHHVTWHNMGMCYEYKEDIENAKKCYQKSLELKPSYRESKLRLSKLATEPRGESAAVGIQ
ncbi:hypothetical protein JH06_4312 [Blastocystis sp. subtype 4]|uniref:hypothetical protein n=1 Tax=Blastocystis sp. subtype 4 TaxID=944170 RepID=UPI0007116803|nr:hypothetical protein JH06_4312 [Blastocystis sp. subtype 4]KNB43254.1 hypothetical protein JH06_4312 [Blastocystis sp. subtype 4]|eukprot:XP_014526700.1 hypothetical protein JH06_4312 [Blastocystis sp. subtype 4]